MESEKPALFSTAYLPPVQYFMFMASASKVYIEKHETYLKRSYRNRCEIYSANGKLALSIPVNKINGNHTKVDEVQISDQLSWQVSHWRALNIAYANSPYFMYYQDDLEPFYQKSFSSLFNFNLELLRLMLDLIGMEKEVLLTDEYHKKPQDIDDFRYTISPRIARGDIRFKPYYQSFSDKHGFIPGLSILDLLFNMGPETLGILS